MELLQEVHTQSHALTPLLKGQETFQGPELRRDYLFLLIPGASLSPAAISGDKGAGLTMGQASLSD